MYLWSIRIHSHRRTVELHNEPNSRRKYSPKMKHINIKGIHCKNNKTNGHKKIKWSQFSIKLSPFRVLMVTIPPKKTDTSAFHRQ